MIDAKELRIGNLVLNPSTGETHQVSILDINDMDLKYKERNPIQLTNELLVKYGFENTGRFCIGKSGYEIYKNGKIELMQKKKMEPFILAIYETKILFVHQLQNLCFAITGLELTIKE